MKKNRSVFELMVRSNFYRILLLLTAMVILQTGLFLFAFHRRFGTEAFSLESLLKKSYIELVFFGVFIAMIINSPIEKMVYLCYVFSLFNIF